MSKEQTPIEDFYMRLCNEAGEAGWEVGRAYLELELTGQRYTYTVSYDTSDIEFHIFEAEGKKELARLFISDTIDHLMTVLPNLIVDLEAGRKDPANIGLDDLE